MASFDEVPSAFDIALAERVARSEARRWLRSGHDVDDVIQESLLRAWRGRHRRRGADLRPWMRQIARNEAFRHLDRNRRYALEAEPEDHLPAAGDHADAAALRLDVRRAVAALEPPDRALVAGRYGLDLTHPALAEVLRLPEGTVKVRLHRLRKRLATDLAPMRGSADRSLHPEHRTPIVLGHADPAQHRRPGGRQGLGASAEGPAARDARGARRQPE